MKPNEKKYILEHKNNQSIKEIACALGLKECKVEKFLKRKSRVAKSPVPPMVSLMVIVLIVMGCALYCNSIFGEFIWDDEYLVVDNPLIKNWSEVAKIFTKDIGEGVGHKFNFYRPVQMLTYMIDYSLWKNNPKGYHFTNLVFHILAALALFWFVNLLFKNSLLSFLTSLLFVIHPIHTEAVCYISGRADLLALCFSLLMLSFYVKYLEGGGLKSYLLMIVSFLFALLSKEHALILPVMLLLIHYVRSEKLKVAPYIPFLVITFIYVLLRLTILDFKLEGNIPVSAFLERVPGFFIALFQYFRLMILPFNQHMEYGNTLFAFSDPRVFAGAALFIAALVWLWKKRYQEKLVGFGIIWFFITLAPVSNLYPINAYMAEHWLYLPSIGLFLIVGNSLCALRKKTYKDVFKIVTVLIVLSYSVLTFRQNRYWANPVIFYKQTLHYAPSERMYNGLALAYYYANRPTRTVEVFKEAIERYPDSAFFYNNLGAIYLSIKRNKQAQEMFETAIKVDSEYGEAYSNLAIIYFRKKHYSRAIKYCDKAKELGFVNKKLLNDLESYR